MNFIEAVKAAKNGHKIRRASWVNNFNVQIHCGELIRSDNGKPLHMIVALCLADDWEIVGDEPKKMCISEAMTKVKEGYAVRRQGWVNVFVQKDKVFHIARIETKKGDITRWVKAFTPTMDEFEAHDRVIARKEEQ